MKSLRWGLIGTGDVAERKSGPALYQTQRSELVAVYNRSIPKAASFAQRHGDVDVADCVDTLLNRDDIDAVYIATPPESHCELTVQCATAGKHVLCEKPMALSLDDCHKMIVACQEHDVSLAIAYYRRYFPVVQQIKTLLDSGAVGIPLRVAATTYSQFQSDDPSPWRLDHQMAGGGFLMDVGTHRFDLMAYFFGSPIDIRCISGTQTMKTSVEDAASVVILFEGGVQATASFQWNSPVTRDTLEIVGSEGIIWTDSLSDEGRLWLETSQGTQSWVLPASAPVHQRLVEKFVEHLLDGPPNPLDGQSGSIATAMTLSCYGTPS